VPVYEHFECHSYVKLLAAQCTYYTQYNNNTIDYDQTEEKLVLNIGMK